MEKLIISLVLGIYAWCFTISGFAKEVDKDLVIAQMNSCVNTLTNIINNKSMSVLNYETDQLLNNLTMEHIVGLSEIGEFRGELVEAIGKLQITEKERELLKKVNSIKRDNLKWQALSNALSNTMMITGGGQTGIQMGFQALTTAARTAVEYKTAGNELEIEELQAMFDLRKKDLTEFIELRKEALKIILSLYQKYQLKEADRLTEQTSQQFQRIISEKDPKKMIRLLTDSESKYGHIADYYYYLGMGYNDIGELTKASKAFAKYDEIYNKAPIYRINDKSGLISLARLSHFNNLSNPEIEKEIKKVINNIPNNAFAIIQCALIYDNILKQSDKAIALLRAAVDNESCSDRDAVLFTASLILPKISNQRQEYKDFIAAYAGLNSVDILLAINMCIAKKESVFQFLKKTITVKDLINRPYYLGSPEVNDKIKFSFPLKYYVDLSKVRMFVEKHGKGEVKVDIYTLFDESGISIEEIEKIRCFKENPNLKYSFFEEVNNVFKIKSDLKINEVKLEYDNSYPYGIGKYDLNDEDRKSIIKFLKKKSSKSLNTNIIAEKVESSIISYIDGIAKNVVYPKVMWEIYRGIKHLISQEGKTYMKFQLDDIRRIEICYEIKLDEDKLIPCYIQYQGKRYFVNKLYLKEFGYDKPASNNKTVEKKKPSNNGEKKKVENKKEKSWWDKLWDSDDTKSNADSPTNEKGKGEKSKKANSNTNKSKSEDKKEKSWWDKLWDSDDTKSNADSPTNEKGKGEKSKKANSNTNKSKSEDKKEKSWWDKLWDSDDKKSNVDSSTKGEGKGEKSKKANSKNKKEDNKEDKSWWKFW